MSTYGLVGLLKLIEASDGTVDTRIRIQKEAFLLALKGYRNFRSHAFRYHHFGPFSREVSETIQTAVSAGLIVEEEEKFPDGTRKYTYRLTEAGRTFIDGDEELPANMREYVRTLNREHWRALELAATVAYLEHRSRAPSRADAFELAKKLKPETAPYSERADKILDALGV